MSNRPNILLIMDDQHRFDYLGCMGADFVQTPNIDKLAARGILFTHCTTNCPVCAPARIGLVTGVQPCKLGSVDNQSYLPRTATTYFQRLRDHGYRVGSVGKLDLAKPDPYNGRNGDRPCNFGWGITEPHETEGKMHGGSSATPQGPYGFWLQEQGIYQLFHDDYSFRGANGWIKAVSHDSVLSTDAFEESYIGRHAVEWLRTVNDDFPWHYFVSFVGPHDPFDPPTEYAVRYRRAAMPPAIHDGLDGKPDHIRQRVLDMTSEEVTVTRRQYCAIIELIDFWIGEMIAALEQRSLLENTIILFTSDHGEMLGDHGLYTKSVPYEPAIRVPLIVAGPGVKHQRSSGALAELIDLNPTICELAGIPEQEQIDGLSLGRLLRGETDEHRREAVSVIRQFSLIRTRHHKLIDHHNAGYELYDLESDPHELLNIAADNRSLLRELRDRLVERLAAQE